MKRFRWSVLFAVLLLIALPAPAGAAELRGGDTVTIAVGETINDDLYVSGGNVQILGTVNGDVFAGAGNITVNGTVNGGLTSGGGTVIINGSITQGVRLGGGTLTVNGRIGRDLVAGGGTLVVGPEARITGDLLIAAGTATIAGTVGRDVRGTGGDIRIDAQVGRDVVLTDIQNLTIGSGARISGALQYSGAREATITPGAQIAQNRGFTPTTPTTQPGRPPVNPVLEFVGWIWSVIRSFLGTAVLGALLLWLFPRPMDQLNLILARSPGASLGVGALAFFLVPVVLTLLFVVGLLIGTFPVWFVLSALFVIGVALAGAIIGRHLGERIFVAINRSASPYIHLLVGALVLAVLGALPFIGWLFNLAVALIGVGAAMMAIWRSATRDQPLPAFTVGGKRPLQTGVQPA